MLALFQTQPQQGMMTLWLHSAEACTSIGGERIEKVYEGVFEVTCRCVFASCFTSKVKRMEGEDDRR